MLIGDVISYKLELGYIKSATVYKSVFDYVSAMRNLNHLSKTILDLSGLFDDLLVLSRALSAGVSNGNAIVDYIERPYVDKKDVEIMSLLIDTLFLSSVGIYNEILSADDMDSLYIFDDILTSELDYRKDISFDAIDGVRYLNEIYIETSVSLMRKFYHIRKLYLNNIDFVLAYIGYRLIEPDKKRIIATLVTL